MPVLAAVPRPWEPLQWSRDLSTTEIMIGLAEAVSGGGFNGAVIFRPRKYGNGRMVCL